MKTQNEKLSKWQFSDRRFALVFRNAASGELRGLAVRLMRGESDHGSVRFRMVRIIPNPSEPRFGPRHVIPVGRLGATPGDALSSCLEPETALVAWGWSACDSKVSTAFEFAPHFTGREADSAK